MASSIGVAKRLRMRAVCGGAIDHEGAKSGKPPKDAVTSKQAEGNRRKEAHQRNDPIDLCRAPKRRDNKEQGLQRSTYINFLLDIIVVKNLDELSFFFVFL